MGVSCAEVQRISRSVMQSSTPAVKLTLVGETVDRTKVVLMLLDTREY